jgi:hypothetical protein
MHWTGGTAPRAHGTLREIRIGDFRSIRRLDRRHPVFLLEFNAPDAAGTTQLVIKFDFGKDRGVRFTATTELMQLIDPRAIAEVVSDSEKVALRLMEETDPGRPTLHQMLTFEDFFCVKMKVRKNFAELESGGKVGSDEIAVDAVMQQLPGNEDVWRRLGEIVAVDLFLGNADRIAPSPGGRPGEAVLQNLGNIFLKFDKHGRLKKALGLDNYEGSGQATDLGQGVPRDWQDNFAPILKNAGIARDFSRSVIEQVVRHGAKVGAKVDLGEKEREWFFRGMMSAREKVKAFLVRRGGQVMPGIMSRAQYLGWA